MNELLKHSKSVQSSRDVCDPSAWGRMGFHSLIFSVSQAPEHCYIGLFWEGLGTGILEVVWVMGIQVSPLTETFTTELSTEVILGMEFYSLL